LSDVAVPPPAAALLEPTLPLVIGVSTRALFRLEEEHAIFVRDGVAAYARLQREREQVHLEPGAAFEVVKRLLALNCPGAAPLVDVLILSQNSPDLSLRAFASVEHHGLSIKRGSFTSGRPVAPFITAWNVDLFLSNDEADVREAVRAGAAAAKLGPPPSGALEVPPDEVRFAFDGDAVVFSAESDAIYKENGLAAFLAHERHRAEEPMQRGPFGNFLHKLSAVRERAMRPEGESRVRISIVTARNAPAHARVVHTLRAWGTPADEAHFVGTGEKGPILKASGAHIFFDDQEKHVLGAAEHVAAALVPGPHAPSEPIIPAG
jgi:5'-nucleotidase